MNMLAATPDEIIEDLKAGNRRFLDGQSIHSAASSLKKLKDMGPRQFPKAVILCCSDSRAPVEMIFDQAIGDVFVIRVAGNIIAPSLVGSVEYAASTFGTKLVLVMGHTQCGAVRATLDHIHKCETVPSENIHDIVSRIKPHIFPISQAPGLSDDDQMARSVEANVRASVGQLSYSSRIIEDLVKRGQLTVRGAVLNIATGKVEFMAD